MLVVSNGMAHAGRAPAHRADRARARAGAPSQILFWIWFRTARAIGGPRASLRENASGAIGLSSMTHEGRTRSSGPTAPVLEPARQAPDLVARRRREYTRATASIDHAV